MDPKTYDAVRQAVTEGFTRNSLLIIAVTALVSVVSGYLLAYVRRKGENLATKEDFDALKVQLEANTRLTMALSCF
jgi:ABC-type spermidine/putrescine transport system permease subunit II